MGVRFMGDGDIDDEDDMYVPWDGGLFGMAAWFEEEEPYMVFEFGLGVAAITPLAAVVVVAGVAAVGDCWSCWFFLEFFGARLPLEKKLQISNI